MSKKYYVLLLLALILISAKSFSQAYTPKPASDTLLSFWNKCLKCINENNWDSALYYAKVLEPMKKSEEGDTSDLYAASVYLIGEIYRIKNDYLSAYPFFKRSVDIYAKCYPRIYIMEGYADALLRLGMVSNFLGAQTDAEIYFVRGSVLYQSLKVMDLYAQINLALASIYIEKGNYVSADSLNEKIEEVLDSLPKNDFVQYLQSATYNNEAMIYSQTDNMPKALTYMKKAVNLSKNIEGFVNNQNLEMVLNLADAYSLNGSPDTALLICKKVEDSLTTKRSDNIYAELLKEKSLAFQLQKKIPESIKLLRQYKNMTDTFIVKPNDYEGTIANLGILYTATKQFPTADTLFRSEIKRLQYIGLENSYSLQQYLAAFCSNLINMERYDEASDSLLALCKSTLKVMQKNIGVMSADEQLKYKNGLDIVFNLLYVCIASNKVTNTAIVAEAYRMQLQRKSLILNNQIKLMNVARNLADTTFQTLHDSWINNKQVLSKQYSLPNKDRFLKIDSLEEINETLEKKVYTSSLASSVIKPNASVTDSLFRQPRFVADIEFIRITYANKYVADSSYYAAFVLRPQDSIPVFVKLCSEKSLLRLMKDRNGNWIDVDQLTQKFYSKNGVEASTFYKLVWKPLEVYLKEVKKINYSTAGLLNNISFNAITNGKEYLMNRYELTRYLNIMDAATQQQKPKIPENISVWGNMNYDKAVYGDVKTIPATIEKSDESFTTIPGEIKTSAQTKFMNKRPLQSFGNAEISNLKKIFIKHNLKWDLHENENATEDNIKVQSAKIRGILHISTHGFYTTYNKLNSNSLTPGGFIAANENPLFRCGLAFSGVNYYWLNGRSKINHDDGILTGYEVSQLDLHNVQLVTLSACETGLGDVTESEGNIGLQHAFKLAGAKNLLLSLWQVPAKETAILISLFYENLFKGYTYNSALLNAEKVLQQKKYPPYYWAGFVLIE